MICIATNEAEAELEAQLARAEAAGLVLLEKRLCERAERERLTRLQKPVLPQLRLAESQGS
jgi:hypothetical protein